MRARRGGSQRVAGMPPRTTVFLAVVTLLVAGLVLADALAAITARRNPDVALTVRPGAPIALTSLAEQIVTAQPAAAGRAAELARRSLVAAPLQPRALRILGMGSEAGGDQRLAAQQVRVGQQLSRRDLLTQLWAVEDAVRRGDVPGALRHYDIALRVELDSQSLLFPLLAGGLSEPAIAAGLLPYLQRPTPWSLAFVLYAAEKGEHPATLARLLARRPDPSLRTPAVSALLLRRLVFGGDFAEAYAYARSIPGYTPSLGREVALRGNTTLPALRPLAWTPLETNGAFARLDPDGASVQAFADVGAAGDVLERFMTLPPGRYRLTTAYAVTTASPGAKATWKAKCLRGGRFDPYWSNGGKAVAGQSRSHDELTIADDCRHQHLALSIDASADAAPLDYQITAITLQPVS